MHRFDGDGRVPIVRGGDQHGIHQPTLDQRGGAVETRHVEIVGGGLERRRVNVGDSGQFDLLDLGHVVGMAGAHATHANDTETHNVHPSTS